MAEAWVNDDGLVLYFGTRTSENERPGVLNINDRLKTATVTIKYDKMLSPVNKDGGIFHLPAGATLYDAQARVTTAWAGGTNLMIGTAQQDGTAIDANGIGLETQLTTANLTLGAVFDLTGAQIGKVVDAANDAYLTSAVTGTYTAGELELRIRYFD